MPSLYWFFIAIACFGYGVYENFTGNWGPSTVDVMFLISLAMLDIHKMLGKP